MLSIFVCEDEQKIREYLVDKIEKYIMIQGYDMTVVCATDNPDTLLAKTQEVKRGIYFLDVDLKHSTYNGFSLAKVIREQDENGFIMFVTTHGELTFETFRLHLEAMDYIVKDEPNVEERLHHCLDVISERVSSEENGVKAYYTVKTRDTLNHILVDDILYFETSSIKHRVILHTKDELLEFPGSLSEVEEKLSDNFLRVHRSFLINRDKIARTILSENRVQLTNGEDCPVARRFKKKLYDLGV